MALINLKEYRYHNLDRKKASTKWKNPLKELVENKVGITLDEKNPNNVRKLKWMSTLNEAVCARDHGRSILITESGYDSVDPAHLVGMGAITNPNSTNTGNTRTTADSDKGSGDYSKRLTITSMHIAAATIAFELLPVIAIEVPMVQMTFVESVYGGTKVADTEKSPQYIEIPVKMFKALDALTTDFEGAGTVVAINGIVKLTEQTIYYLVGNGVAVDTLLADKGLQLRFAGQHHVTGAYRFQVLSNITVTNAATGTFTQTPTEFVSTFLNDFAVIGANAYALTWNNGGTLAFTDAQTVKVGSATTSADIIPIGLVDTKETAIYGASHSDGFTTAPMNREVSELGTENSITVRSWSTSAKVSDFDITCAVTTKQERDFRAMGLSAFEIALEAAKTQLVQSTNNHILDTMFKLGVENHIQVFEASNLNLHLYVDDPLVANSLISAMNISSVGSFNLQKLDGTDVSAQFGAINNFRQTNYADGYQDVIRMVKSRTNLVSALIGKLNRTTKADFVVCATGLSASLVDNRNHDLAPVEQNLLIGADVLSYFGKCEGMDLYVDPRMDLADNRILVGRRGNELDSGLKYFVYDLLSEIQTIEGLSMSKKALVSTSYALISAGHHPETNYMTFIAENAGGLWS